MSESERKGVQGEVFPRPVSSIPVNGAVQVINITRNTEIASRVEVASSGAKRSKGLLGRKGLQQGTGIWIVPCEAIHTFFMRFAIDVVYLDKKLRIKKVVHSIGPWRMSACLSAHSVLEVASGTIVASESRPGDVLEFLPIAEQGTSLQVEISS